MKIGKVFLLLLAFQSIAMVCHGARPLRNGRCDELYIVKDGETLQTISEKCNAPFLLFDNPHILDTDDIGEGVVLRVRCSSYDSNS
ncbi:hypothetical protein AMTRI_Chr06g201590 [Amborella trichopoda]